MFLPLPLLALPAGHLADRYPRRTILVAAIAIDAVVAVGLLLVTRAGAGQTWPFFALAFGTGLASALGAPGRSGADAVARPAGRPRQGIRAALDRLPALGDRRPGARRPAVRAPSRARLRGVRPCSRSSRSRPSCNAGGPRRRGRGLARPRERPRRRSARPAYAGAPRGDLARPLRRALRRRGGAAAGVRARHPGGRPRRASGSSARRPPSGALCAAAVMSRRPLRRRAGRTLLTVVAALRGRR